ncbi:phosphoribosylformylglycinamidine (FGAM) synthase, synthetase domain [Candidatus Scalindua japonica]|uniref:Phosphoribosylformylglycinamidine (FGAM) synthase, synthetase domain n=1 Tax=Candidatus Scalindua japonica TaxID=1284222 RepID=A0A286U2D9_9BACT|nr:phosphoribosylformylglycinamidine (FGAM) synthase, synthetase domain [Candidatus Scalindua japonica]
MYLDKIFATKPVGFNEFKQAINSLLEFSAASELSKNATLANGYFGIKSARGGKKLPPDIFLTK